MNGTLQDTTVYMHHISWRYDILQKHVPVVFQQTYQDHQHSYSEDTV